MLVNGNWDADWHPFQAKDARGRFQRQVSSFRHWVTGDGTPGPTGEGGFAAQSGRYHLYVALICPWASRTLMARRLKNLADHISVSVVEPALTDQGWRFGDFPGADFDTLNGATYMHEIYTGADPGYTGRATVPVLWDKTRRTIVNNESADIIRMLNTAFDEIAEPAVDLYPQALRDDIDELNRKIYEGLNNGVYRAGFASTQGAYEEAFAKVSATLSELEARLGAGGPYLFGSQLTETDIRLFVTGVRFDAAYHGLFKCNARPLADYEALSEYLKRIIRLPGMVATVNIEHIKAGYYSILALNPSGIVPVGPRLDFLFGPA